MMVRKGFPGYAFENCTNLISILIPADVCKIGPSPFKGCTALTGITVDKSSASFNSAEGVLFTKNVDTLVCYPDWEKQRPVAYTSFNCYCDQRQCFLQLHNSHKCVYSGGGYINWRIRLQRMYRTCVFNSSVKPPQYWHVRIL